jgi:hypothetical protein
MVGRRRRTLFCFLVLAWTPMPGLAAQSAGGDENRLVIDPDAVPLTRIQQLIAGADGGAWAIDSRIRGVLRIEPSGSVSVLGREGSGPGEFSDPWRLSLVRDTLWVTDVGLDRITGIDPKTGLPLGMISGFSVWSASPLKGGVSVAPLSVAESGEVLVAIHEPGSSVVELALVRRSWPVEHRRVLELAREDDDLTVVVPGERPPIRFTNPFSNADLLTLDARGRVVGAVRQDSTLVVDKVALDGSDRRSSLRWSLERSFVSTEERRTWLAVEGEGWIRTFARRGIFETPAAARKAIESALPGGRRPVVRRATRGVFERSTFIDRKGAVWLEGWNVGRSPRPWYRLDEGGAELTLTLADDEVLLDADDEFAWVQGFDELGVPRVSRIRWKNDR